MIECFFDCSSPWSYLGFRGVQALADELGETVAWRAILVGGVFNAVNPSVYDGREKPVPLKYRYSKKDLADWARLYGLKLIFPPRVFPVNSVKAMRGCLWLEPQGKLVAFAEAVFAAYFTDNRDISDDAVLADLCRQVDVDPRAFLAAIAGPDIKAALVANGEELIARGGFGSPTFFVGDDLYFGNDRLMLLRDALLRARGAAPATLGLRLP